MNDKVLKEIKELVKNSNERGTCGVYIGTTSLEILYNIYFKLKKDYDDLKIDYDLLIKEKFNKLEEENDERD